MIRTIAAGFISDDARAFLLAHQVPINSCQNLEIVPLDEMIAAMNETADPMEYVAGFWTNDGSDMLEDCVIIFLNVDSHETKLILRKDYWSKFPDMPGKPMVL